MKFINKQYGIRETGEFYRVNDSYATEDAFFSLEVTLAKLVRKMEIRRRDATL